MREASEALADAYGRVTIDLQQAFEVIYDGGDLKGLLLAPSPEIAVFNERLATIDREDIALAVPAPIAHSPEEEHASRASTWLIGDEIADLDLAAFFESLCKTEAQRERAREELALFADRGLFPLLRAMICLVSHWRERGVLWGVGRGSSVASFILYLIGVNRIDPMRYGLDIKEFLRD